jgi:hypothetical protein
LGGIRTPRRMKTNTHFSSETLFLTEEEVAIVEGAG